MKERRKLKLTSVMVDWKVEGIEKNGFTQTQVSLFSHHVFS
jgi:hypothetical protein